MTAPMKQQWSVTYSVKVLAVIEAATLTELAGRTEKHCENWRDMADWAGKGPVEVEKILRVRE